MGAVKSVLPDDLQQVAGSVLQGTLVDLLDLSLTVKQAHWNITGRTFKQVHEHLDELVAETRAASDSVAERAVALGVNPDGRLQTVARATQLPALEPGYLPEDKVVSAITHQLAAVIGRMRVRIAEVEPEPLTQDLLIGITRELEKQHWMFSVQQ